MGLKVGLEIHCQLLTGGKLFSQAAVGSMVRANRSTAFFDLAIPGSQPLLNPQCLLKAIKMAKFLHCSIPDESSFDRKHYFYGDQPLGYQITQHFNPIATGGHFEMSPRHFPKLQRDLRVSIQQIQLEQDTARSIYKSSSTDKSLIDFNRGNTPLIEMVTGPDFQSVDEVRAFLQVLVKSLRDLDVSIGDLESGSIRVDVNVSVGEHKRVEVKNLPTISAIVNAIRFEAKRQSTLVDEGQFGDSVETRGWDGKETVHLRSKESQVDYRYVPDMELPLIKLQVDDILAHIPLPPSYGEQIDALMSQYNMELRDAKVLLNDEELLLFFKQCHNLCSGSGKPHVINWVVHDLIGGLSKSNVKFTKGCFSVNSLVELIDAVEANKVSKLNGKLLLLHLINNKQDQGKHVLDLANEFNLLVKDIPKVEIESITQSVLANNTPIIDEILNGKQGKINFLIGQCMKLSAGSVKPDVFKSMIKSYLDEIKKN